MTTTLPPSRAIGFALLIAFVAALGDHGASDANAQGAPPSRSTPPQDAAAAVARRLNCPLCQGYNLQDCPLVVCAQMRELIAEELAAGATDAEVIADFVAQYGPQVLNEPPRSGFHLLAWYVPVLALVGAGGLAAFLALRGRQGERAPPRRFASAHPGPSTQLPAGGEVDAGSTAEARARFEDLVDQA